MGIEPFLVATSVHLICAQRWCVAFAATARVIDMPVQR